MIKVGIIGSFVFFVTSVTFAQKVKYKDLYGLLSTKQYEQAEPFLKKYLQENDDNPNAFLYMGIIYQEKSAKGDILKQTSVVVKNMDSAVYFFDKANKTIDEREVRKNKEYYQAYNRRDLRTGDFGVKLSDIQFDLEKKMEGLRERIDRLKMVKYYFTFTDSLYKSTNKLFNTLREPYANENEFFLRSDENTLNKLELLASRFDSTLKFFENYKASLQNLGNAGYNQRLQLDEITDFKKDGGSLSNLFESDIRFWDYKKFAVRSSEIIDKEIIPMRELLVSYDVELNKLREKLNSDSVSVKSELTKIIEKLVNKELRKFDNDPLPVNIFAMKIADLEYKSTLLENKALRDSMDVHFQLKLIQAEQRCLDKLDSMATKLSTIDLDKQILNYQHFIANTYSNGVILQSYVKAEKEYAQREKQQVKNRVSEREMALHWIIADGDSIPLSLENRQSVYKPLAVEDEKYTIGLTYADSLNASGYFCTITPSRLPDLKVNFPVDKINFKADQLSELKALTANSDDQVYYIVLYSDKLVKDNYPATMAKIYRSDGLAWSNNYSLKFIPTEILYKQDTGELTLKADQQVAVFDKNGKPK